MKKNYKKWGLVALGVAIVALGTSVLFLFQGFEEGSRYPTSEKGEKLDLCRSDWGALGKWVGGMVSDMACGDQVVDVCDRGRVGEAITRAVGAKSCKEVSAKALNDIKYLNLSKREIGSLPLNAFSGLSYLESLHLEKNEISEIDPRIFSNLRFLKKLNLAENRLEGLSINNFIGLKNLKELDLKNQKSGMRELTALNFAGLASLKWLSLSSNSLSELEDGVFSHLVSLEKLFLNRNDLKRLRRGMFAGLSELEVLSITHNKIEFLEEGRVFAELVSLEKLYLDHNRMRALPLRMFGESCPFYLSVGFNQIKRVEPGTFLGCDDLLFLDLRANLIEKLEEETFKGVAHDFRQLYLQNNRITQVDYYTFKTINDDSSPIIGRVYLDRGYFLKGNPWCHGQERDVWKGLMQLSCK